jgi:uncharacterized membrane protein
MPLEYAQPQPHRKDLREIATRQRAIMYCILGYIVFAILQFAVPAPFGLIFTLLAVGSSITGAVFVFMLAIAIYNTGVGVVLGILTLIPLIGLITLLIVNGKATKLLREHGIKVGLMGANLKQFPPT